MIRLTSSATCGADLHMVQGSMFGTMIKGKFGNLKPLL